MPCPHTTKFNKNFDGISHESCSKISKLSYDTLTIQSNLTSRTNNMGAAFRKLEGIKIGKESVYSLIRSHLVEFIGTVSNTNTLINC